MKIEKSCNPIPAPFYSNTAQIPAGTVFRFNSLTAGPYLKVVNGVVDLVHNMVYADAGGHSLSTAITRLVILDKARVVTGEE